MFLCVIEPLGQSTHRTNEEISSVFFSAAAKTNLLNKRAIIFSFFILASFPTRRKTSHRRSFWMLNGQKSQSEILFPRYNC